jgi:hypothetical protein
MPGKLHVHSGFYLGRRTDDIRLLIEDFSSIHSSHAKDGGRFRTGVTISLATDDSKAHSVGWSSCTM